MNRMVFWMLVIALAFLVGKATGTATAPAKGEFRRVPRWWVQQALCVHHGEGSWSDPNGPYYGGMQMNLAFMRHYGGDILRRFGTADHWHPRTQLIVAYRGWRSQGWGAWPVTSRRCGLR